MWAWISILGGAVCVAGALNAEQSCGEDVGSRCVVVACDLRVPFWAR